MLELYRSDMNCSFSIGAVITSVLSLFIIPRNSCPEHMPVGNLCDVEKQNNGWRWMLGILGLIVRVLLERRIIY